MEKVNRFLDAILGQDGAAALRKTAERSSPLASALLPRSIMSWLTLAGRWGYEGEIPGVPGSWLRFHKTEQDTFQGCIEAGGEQYDFDHASLTHLAACTAVCLGMDARPIDPALKPQDVERLGKNLDLLVMTRFVNFLKSREETAGECSCQGECSCEETSSPDLEKAPQEQPGQPAGARQPIKPAMAVPQAKQPRQNPTRPPTMKVTKHQVDRPCQVCDGRQFENGSFQGCYCLKDLSRFVKAERNGDGFVLHFGSEWSANDIAVLVDMMGAP